MPVYRALSSSEGTTVATALSTSDDASFHQAEDLPQEMKARTTGGIPKAVSSRNELADSDYVTIIDPVTGQRYETSWASAKMTGLDAYIAISDQAIRDGQRAASEIPRGELNEPGESASGREKSIQEVSEPIYEPDRDATQIADTLAYHGGMSPQEVEGVVASFITQDMDDEVMVGFFQERGIDHNSLQGMVDTVWERGQSQAAQELSPEDYEFLGNIANENPEIRELTMFHAWNAMTGKARMTWPQFAQQIRSRVGSA